MLGFMCHIASKIPSHNHVPDVRMKKRKMTILVSTNRDNK
jgi:hypothetical protein